MKIPGLLDIASGHDVVRRGCSASNTGESMHLTKRIEMVGGFFWLCFALFVMEQSYRLSLGTFRKPGEGLLPFLGGAGIFLLSIVLLIGQLLRKPFKPKREELNIRYVNIFAVLFSLLIYAILLEWLGFLVSTFLLMGFLLKAIENKNWIVLSLTSLVGSIVAWIVFKLWLGIQLPRGILPF